MPDTNDPSNKESQSTEFIKTIAEVALKNEELRKSVGRRMIYTILSTAIVASIKLIIGISFIPLTYTPLVGITMVLLIAAMGDLIRSTRPQTVFFICSEEGKFISIKRSSFPKYGKLKSCSDCGCALSENASEAITSSYRQLLIIRTHHQSSMASARSAILRFPKRKERICLRLRSR